MSLSEHDQKILKMLQKQHFLHPTLSRTIESFMEKWSLNSLDAVLTTHILTEQRLADAIAEEFGIQRIYDLSTQTVHKNNAKMMGADFMEKWTCIPLEDCSSNQKSLQIASFNPNDPDFVAALKEKLKDKKFEVCIAEKSEITKLLSLLNRHACAS